MTHTAPARRSYLPIWLDELFEILLKVILGQLD